MSFILRTVDEHNINYHTYLGEKYDVVNRERSPEYFETLLNRDPFGGDSKKAFVYVSYSDGYKYIQQGEHAYIMISNGETFDNLTPKSIFKLPKLDNTEPTNEIPYQFDSRDIKPKSWLKLEKATVHKLCINKDNEVSINTYNEFGRNVASFLNVQKEMHEAGYCMIFPTYDGKFIICGFTGRGYNNGIYESDNIKKIGSKIHVLSQADSNGQYYLIQLDECAGEFLVSDETCSSRVGYGLLLDRETVYNLISEK